MIDYLAIVVNFLLFALVIVIFAKDKDYAAYSLLISFVACLFTSFRYRPNVTLETYQGFVDFSPLIFIICSQIMITIAEEKEIFRIIAIKALHVVKARPRPFLYMISLISSLIAAITPDVMVSLIFIPLVIRVAKVLKVDPKPFMYCVTINMNIGACLAPLNPTNFIIAVAFGKSPFWFFKTVIGMYLINTFLTTFLLDMIFLRKQPTPDEHLRKIVMELLNTDAILESPKEKKSFIWNTILFFGFVILFFVFSRIELVSVIGAVVLSLVNRKEMEKSFEKVDWKIIIFIIGMFLMIGDMGLAGTFEMIALTMGNLISHNVISVAIFIVLVASFFSAFLDNTPVALMIIPILQMIFTQDPSLLTNSTPIIFGLIAAVNLGGNLLPQGAAGDLMTLSQAKKHGITDFNYRSLTKVGGSFALLHILLTIIIILLMVWTGFN
jgi:Na+/H+ antiporter NhaD/arsenite permease-like protein